MWIRGGLVNYDEVAEIVRAPRETLKQSAKSWTYRSGDWVVKESSWRRGAALFKLTFQPERRAMAWKAASFFSSNGIPTPEPLAYVEWGVLGIVWKNAFIARHLDGFFRSDHYLASMVGRGAEKDELRLYFEKLAEAVAALAPLRIYHSDLTGKNILTRDGRSFQFIDLEAVSLNVDYNMERRLRNHMQLYDSLLEWAPDEALTDLIRPLTPAEYGFDEWMNLVREARRIRRERAEELWRKYGRKDD
jgi:hypothetical protein